MHNSDIRGRRSTQMLRWGAAVLLAAATLAPMVGCVQEAGPAGFSELDDPRVPTSVVEGLHAGVPQRVIVTLDDSGIEEQIRGNKPVPDGDAYAAYVQQRQAAFDRLKGQVLGQVASTGYAIEQDYRNLPMMVLEVNDASTMAELLQRDEVVGFHVEEFMKAFLSESLPMIDQPSVQADGNTGAGTAVAVLDTGVRYHYSAFGSCSAPGGSCKVAAALDTAPDDGKRDPDGHGTNVAGTVLGVAPGADIISIDVFTGASASSTDIIEAIDWCVANRATYNIVAMNMSLGGGLYSSNCDGSAFGTAIDSARAAGILSVIATGNDANVSKGASPACVSSSISVGAVYDSNMGSIGWSACSDASTAADKVTCFSNSPSWMTMLAPGALITAATITQGGTSQATPHVAGAVAVLRALFPSETLTQTVDRLTSSGVSVTDSRNGRVRPRLDLAQATLDCTITIDPLSATVGESGGTGSINVTDPCSNGWTATTGAGWIELTGASGTGSGTVTWDAEVNYDPERVGTVSIADATFSLTQDASTQTPPPTPTPPEPSATPETAPPTDASVEINGGDDYTNYYMVSLALSATDDSGVADMCISNTNSCTQWVEYAETYDWVVSGGNATRTVYVWFRDTFGNVSARASDTIFLDMELPRDGSVGSTPGDGEVVLSWSDYSDRHSGVESYVVVMGQKGIPSTCDTGNLVYEGVDTTTTHIGVTNGNTYYYRVCAVDVAGNMSTGASATSRPAPEHDSPTGGSVSINSGDAETDSASVTLSISASDASTVTKMCLSNTQTCSNWVAYNTTKSWNLTGGSGDRVVYVWFTDEWNNATDFPVSDDILLDVTVPDDGTLQVTAGDGENDLSWSGFSDAHSGIDSYKLVFGNSGTPAHCGKGQVAYTGTATTFNHAAAENGTHYYYRLCAIDVAGNTSTGALADAAPAPETDAPTGGSISINGGDIYTNSFSVTLALSASDASTVSEVCLSNTNTCSSWQAYSTTKNWGIDSGPGARSVYAWFRDEWGNETSSPVSDSILLDYTPPKDGALFADAGDGQVGLNWSGFSDSGSGLANYIIVYGNRGVPSNCTSGTEIYSGTGTTFTDSSAVNGTVRYYRLCAVDEAGNHSFGVEATATPAPENSAPTGATVEINSGDDYTNTINVALTIGGTDSNDISRMCLSTTPTCSTWMAFNTTKSYNLSVWNGTAHVYVWLEDEWGNVTEEPATDSIYVDTTIPQDGSLTVDPDDTQIELSWPGFTDRHSGVASYKLVYGFSGVPANCNKGNVAYNGAATSFTHTGLTNGQRVYYRLCAYDEASNVSPGVTGDAFPAPEFDAPASGTVSINDGDAYVTGTRVTLTLDAVDASTISSVCISNTQICEVFQNYNTQKSWDLYAGNGTQTVYVWLKDEWGNVTANPITDTIYLDMTLPLDGRLTATPGDTEVQLDWSGFSDKHSGVASYRLMYGFSKDPGTCNSGYEAYAGTDTTFTHTGLSNGQRVYYRVCAVDNAGNMSMGDPSEAIPAPEFDAPTSASVVINADDTYTKNPKVTLTISATDDSTITHMCMAHTNYCPQWVAYSDTKTYNLPPMDGQATIYMWFKDEWQNESAVAVTDTIVLDITPPRDGSANATAGDTENTVSWSGFSDKLSGLAGYRLVYGNKGTPANCNKGHEAYAGTDTSVTHTGLTNGKNYHYRLCGQDEAGNYSSGVTFTLVPSAD